MSGIPRYEITQGFTGEWVLYADHERIVAELRADLAVKSHQIEEHQRLEEEMLTKIEALSAPVSDEEFSRYATHRWGGGFAMLRNDLDRLIAARRGTK